MPYETRADLPEAVQSALADVPHAQSIYRAAYNNAWKQYADPADRTDDSSREETAHAVAWAAVKEQYAKGDDGTWPPPPRGVAPRAVLASRSRVAYNRE